MNSNSCGKGLAIFSIALVLGIGVADSFFSDKTDISNSEKQHISNQSKPICVKQDNRLKEREDEKMVLIPCEIDKEIYFLEPANDSLEIIENIEKNENEVKILKDRLKK